MFDTHVASHKVLVVDDDYVPRSLECFALEGTGRYYALQAGNAHDALDLISAEKPDCAVVDFDMPDMSGVELIDRIRAHSDFRNLPIVLILPPEDQLDARMLDTSRADFVISKPFEPWNLARMLDTLVPAIDDADHVLSVESVLQGYPYPTMILDGEHHVLLANGAFYEATGTGIDECYIFCKQQMHEDGEAPGTCPLQEAVMTGRAAEKTIDTVFGRLRVSVYPLNTKSGDDERLYLHVTQPLD